MGTNKNLIINIVILRKGLAYNGYLSLETHKSVFSPVLYSTWINRYYDVANGTCLSLIPSSSGYYYFKKGQYIYGYFDD